MLPFDSSVRSPPAVAVATLVVSVLVKLTADWPLNATWPVTALPVLVSAIAPLVVVSASRAAVIVPDCVIAPPAVSVRPAGAERRAADRDRALRGQEEIAARTRESERVRLERERTGARADAAGRAGLHDAERRCP